MVELLNYLPLPSPEGIKRNHFSIIFNIKLIHNYSRLVTKPVCLSE
jgi:hypothetical protein